MNMNNLPIRRVLSSYGRTAIEAMKVLSTMAFAFFVLALIGPLTHAVQYFEHLL